MLQVLDTTTETEETPATPTLDALAREGARRMLMAALQVEVAQYVDAYQEARDARGRRLVVRHGVRLEFQILSLNPGLRRRYVGRSAHDLVQRAGTSRADTPVCGPRFLLMSDL